MSSQPLNPSYPHTAILRYPLSELLSLAGSVISLWDQEAAGAAREERRALVLKSRLPDLWQCIFTMDNPQRKDEVDQNDSGRDWDANICGHSECARAAEKALSRLNGEEAVIEAATKLRKETREDPPADDLYWEREDGLLDWLQFITKKEHQGLFHPADYVPVCKNDTMSQSVSPRKPLDHLPAGSLIYPFGALLALARSIIRALEKDTLTAYEALDEGEEGEEEADLSSTLIDIAVCRMVIDAAQWKADRLRRSPANQWNDGVANDTFEDPREVEKRLFDLDWKRKYMIQMAIAHRKSKRGDPTDQDPNWQTENALLDFLVLVTNYPRKGIFDPVLGDDNDEEGFAEKDEEGRVHNVDANEDA